MHFQLIMSKSSQCPQYRGPVWCFVDTKMTKIFGEYIVLESRRIYVVLRQQSGVILWHLWVKALQAVFTSWFAKKKKTLARQVAGYQGPGMHWFPPVKRLCPGQKLECESSPIMFLMVCTNFQDPADLSRRQTDGINKIEIDTNTLFLLCLWCGLNLCDLTPRLLSSNMEAFKGFHLACRSQCEDSSDYEVCLFQLQLQELGGNI